MKLRFHPDPALPRLAWVTSIDFDLGTVEARHGRWVETGPEGMVEGVWNGDFQGWDFSRSAAFFGSGMTLQGSRVWFSPSRGLVDRLLSCQQGKRFWVSNSLLSLLRAIGGQPAPDADYRHETFTILEGLDGYDPVLRADGPEGTIVRQHYHRPFEVSPSGLALLEAAPTPPFSDYQSYVDMLDRIVATIAANARDPARSRPLASVVTLSAGYDSPAVAAIASRHVALTAYTSRRSNSRIPRWISRDASVDDGGPVAEALGLPVRPLAPALDQLDERLYLAACTADPELVFSSLMDDVRRAGQPTLLFSGYHGDKVWARDPGPAYLGTDLKRGDVSGLPLSEVRLHAGVVHLPLPFVGARSIETLHRISNGPAMRPWSVGGSYDRPIPRRIAEDAGVPRTLFGQRKRAVVATYATPRSRDLRNDFDRWLRAALGITLRTYERRARMSVVDWTVRRGLQWMGRLVGFDRKDPRLWRWLPGPGPASTLHRWAVESLLREGVSATRAPPADDPR